MGRKPRQQLRQPWNRASIRSFIQLTLVMSPKIAQNDVTSLPSFVLSAFVTLEFVHIGLDNNKNRIVEIIRKEPEKQLTWWYKSQNSRIHFKSDIQNSYNKHLWEAEISMTMTLNPEVVAGSSESHSYARNWPQTMIPQETEKWRDIFAF